MSSAPEVTVLIPTFDHGAMIAHAIRTVLSQSFTDFEVIVLGDGAPPVTEELVGALAETDSRLRWIGFPKGEHRGEVHRDTVVRSHARGSLVCYLSDDDLWFPDHLDRMVPALRRADLVLANPITARPDGGFNYRFHDMTQARFRDRVIGGKNVAGISSCGHRVDAYRRLATGWHVTPAGVPSDVHFYGHVLRHGFSAASVRTPTLINFPSRRRADWTSEDRENEVAHFASLVADAESRAPLLEDGRSVWNPASDRPA